MGTTASRVATGSQAPTGSKYGEPVVSRGIVVVNAALAINDIIDAVVLPANHVPVDLVADLDDIDSNASPTATVDAGLITGRPGDTVASRTVGSEFFAGSTIVQTGGVVRMSKVNAARVRAAPIDRSVGLKIAAAVATAITPSLTGLTFKEYKQNTAYVVDDAIRLPDGVVLKVTTAGTTGVYQSPDTNAEVTAFGPAFNIGRAQTTVDGGVTWTCESLVFGVTLTSRPAKDNY